MRKDLYGMRLVLSGLLSFLCPGQALIYISCRLLEVAVVVLSSRRRPGHRRGKRIR